MEDIKDLQRINSPLKRLTPAVPIPDWSNIIYNQQMGVQNEESLEERGEISTECGEKEENVLPCRASVISNTSNYASVSGNILESTSVIHTPVRQTENVRSDSNMSTTQVPVSHSRIVGEVALTPTHSSFSQQAVNPHNSMAALTPMASGTVQAKNSIKLQ